jgi:hypothetical protein
VNYTTQYFEESIAILARIDRSSLDRILDLLIEIKQQKGRIFFLG